VTIAIAIYSAVNDLPIDNRVAMTGEISIRGNIKPVGGILAKIEAARLAGASRVLIPKDNWQSILSEITGIEIIPIDFLEDAIDKAIIHNPISEKPCPLIS
jgi:Lon-like ATP-dependent protease